MLLPTGFDLTFGFFFIFFAINICSTTVYSWVLYKNDSFLGVIDYL